jgi:gas vesicle protein
MSCRNSESALVAFLAGAALGAVAALILTPTTGRDVRKKLGKVTDEGLGKIKEVSREARFRLGPKTPKEAFKFEGGDCWV